MKVFRVTCSHCSLVFESPLFTEVSQTSNNHGFENPTHIPVLEAVDE